MDKNLSESFKNTISLDSLGEMAKETAEVTLDFPLRKVPAITRNEVQRS